METGVNHWNLRLVDSLEVMVEVDPSRLQCQHQGEAILTKSGPKMTTFDTVAYLTE